MPRKILFLSVLAFSLMLSACATTRPRQTGDLSARVKELESQLAAKDQEVQDLQAQLDSVNQSLGGDFLKGEKTSTLIRVSGVTVKGLQKALKKAGYDPGPVDGHIGRKTKKAVKAFQKGRGLRSDGVVGEKTWNLLNQ
ncbi:MAG: peptidoglycan-binding protein [Candidatus Omnitrophica bacterium]|nr:peptidoglycan-binding protein [Candidatus Omnitrophota bacterium]